MEPNGYSNRLLSSMWGLLHAFIFPFKGTTEDFKSEIDQIHYHVSAHAFINPSKSSPM